MNIQSLDSGEEILVQNVTPLIFKFSNHCCPVKNKLGIKKGDRSLLNK